MDSTQQKLGKSLGLDSDLLVSKFTKFKDTKETSEKDKDKVKQKISGPSLRDKKPKSSGKQKTTGKSPRDKKSRSSGKQALGKKAVHEDVASDAEEAEMEDTVVDNEAAASEPVDDDNNIEDSELYKRAKKRDLRWNTKYDTLDFYSDMNSSNVIYVYTNILQKAVFGESEKMLPTEVLDKLKELDPQQRRMVFEKKKK
jgi:hypothetical protein